MQHPFSRTAANMTIDTAAKTLIVLPSQYVALSRELQIRNSFFVVHHSEKKSTLRAIKG